MKKRIYLLIMIIMVAGSCKKLYNPPATSAPNSFLVVEGAINSGADSTFIKLSRTVNIDSNARAKPELNAILSVEGEQGGTYPLIQKTNGMYACAGLNLDNSHKYRLRIQTADNGQYLSDYKAVVNSPPIDSVSYDTKGTKFAPGLNVFVDTHDPTGKVLYYRWEYQETWVFHASFPSYFYSNGDTVLFRNLTTNNITDCWGNDTSSSITIASSAKLSKDIIFHIPITSVISTSEKVGNEYSILVRQYALTADAYNFYVNLKKNTEQLGSIFDPQPSQINGNIHCISNPAQPVIGFIGVGSTASKRIFITNRQLPAWATVPVIAGCHLEFELPKFPCCYYNFNGNENQVDEYINFNKGHYSTPFIPVDAITSSGHPAPIGYTATTRECADCTLRGTNKRPAFWK